MPPNELRAVPATSSWALSGRLAVAGNAPSTVQERYNSDYLVVDGTIDGGVSLGASFPYWKLHPAGLLGAEFENAAPPTTDSSRSGSLQKYRSPITPDVPNSAGEATTRMVRRAYRTIGCLLAGCQNDLARWLRLVGSSSPDRITRQAE